jgi:hypothetical protein
VILKGYTILTENEFKDALINDEDIELFTNLDTLIDVYGSFVEYSEVDYDNGETFDYSDN